MQKLLVAGALAVITLLVVVLYGIHAQVSAAPVASTPVAAVVASQPAPITRAPVAPAKVEATPDGDGDTKVNANSDDFFDRFVERQPKVASRAAMSCYRGGLHRRTMDQWITFSFVGHIKNGEVTFSDVKTKESRLDDKELEDCMLGAVAKAHWHDDSLPDVDHYADETTLNPERGGKKYMHTNDDDATPAPPNTPR
ncbi:MAG: hypothetical protein ABI591_12370 [Kofleriaceae bacterium]